MKRTFFDHSRKVLENFVLRSYRIGFTCLEDGFTFAGTVRMEVYPKDKSRTLVERIKQ